ncbi:hypothetical protein OIU76_023259 [Salix suchowensis]|nr:hypothetical protein OIU76_023259 [Salix suchowensis]KAJ6296996.1 hypothetical protein OIU78_022676 [Salix suchowensis]
MNDRFPDATAEEIDASDATCIICREEMTTAKKLLCGHLFHVHCLRSWLERQHTCPTCRALVVPLENGASTAGGQRGAQPDIHQQGNYGDTSLQILFLLKLILQSSWYNKSCYLSSVSDSMHTHK